MDLDPNHIDLGWIASRAAAWGWVLARVAGLCWTLPTMALPGVDLRVRTLLAVVLGVVLAPLIEQAAGPPPAGSALAGLFLVELLVGVLLGWSAGLIVAAARQGGELVGAQAGLSASALFDPDTGLELSPLGHLYGLIALGVFLAMDGPLASMEVLIESYRAIPAGTWVLNEHSASRAFAEVGSALALSLRVAAPPALSLAVAGIALGWIGRLAPAVPLLALSLPVRSVLGILLVSLSLATLVATLGQAWAAWPWGL
ncbi:MAG: flagellar biosynthetic protein FliR [Isosphaeraceae bacterium]